MNSNHYCTLTLRTLVAVCLAALLYADSPAQTERINDKDGSGVDIVVQGALDSELQPLLAALEGKEQIQIAAWTFWRGRIGAKRVVVSRTEVGPINAVAATTLTIVNFKPKLIINQGTAGANDPEWRAFFRLARLKGSRHDSWRSVSSPIRSFIHQNWKRSQESIARLSWLI